MTAHPPVCVFDLDHTLVSSPLDLKAVGREMEVFVRERWPDAKHIVMVGDAWVDGVAAQAGGIPFIAYRADATELERRGVVVAASIDSLLDLPVALA